MRLLRKIFRRFQLRGLAQKRGTEIIADRLPLLWSKWDKRQLIRLNRICSGLKPFQWDGVPRKVRGTFECQVALFDYGNIKQAPTLADSVRDLYFLRKLGGF